MKPKRLEEAEEETAREKWLEENIKNSVRCPVSKFERIMDTTWEVYRELLNSGVPEENTRFVLPHAVKTKIVVTMNARSLLNFFELRCCLHAQWEIREVANRMLSEVRRIASSIFENAGPACVERGECPEKDSDCPLYPEGLLNQEE